MENQEYVYLLMVDTKYDTFMVECPISTDVRVGDMVEIGIEDAALYGTVEKLICTNINSDEYHIINTMCDMHDKLLNVFRKVWEEKCNEDSDSDQAAGAQAGGGADGEQSGEPATVCRRAD